MCRCCDDHDLCERERVEFAERLSLLRDPRVLDLAAELRRQLVEAQRGPWKATRSTTKMPRSDIVIEQEL
jgi:hypothetical protein